MSYNLLGKIASAHISELRKLAAPAAQPRPAAKPMAPAAKPAAPKKVQPIYDSRGGITNAFDPNLDLSKSKDPGRQPGVPYWPKGRDITTGP